MNISFRDQIKNFNFILGSQSPRRKELLGYIIPDFTTQSKDVDETVPSSVPAIEAAKYLANKKGDTFSNIPENNIVITADTIVICENQILGKPENKNEAVEMLNRLSGKKHKVITGVQIKSLKHSVTFDVSTTVLFDNLSEEDILYYIDIYKPFDKAGSYGIQEWIGATGIKKIDGDYYNVVGLPVNELYNQLKQFMQL